MTRAILALVTAVLLTGIANAHSAKIHQEKDGSISIEGGESPPCPRGVHATLQVMSTRPEDPDTGWFCDGRKIESVPCPEKYRFVHPRKGDPKEW